MSLACAGIGPKLLLLQYERSFVVCPKTKRAATSAADEGDNEELTVDSGISDEKKREHEELIAEMRKSLDQLAKLGPSQGGSTKASSSEDSYYWYFITDQGKRRPFPAGDPKLIEDARAKGDATVTTSLGEVKFSSGGDIQLVFKEDGPAGKEGETPLWNKDDPATVVKNADHARQTRKAGVPLQVGEEIQHCVGRVRSGRRGLEDLLCSHWPR